MLSKKYTKLGGEGEEQEPCTDVKKKKEKESRVPVLIGLNGLHHRHIDLDTGEVEILPLRAEDEISKLGRLCR